MTKALNVKPTHAVIYLRVSTEEQSKSGVGLQAQILKCTEHCVRLGLSIVAVHKDDGISGKAGLDKRPGLRSAITDVQNTPGGVVVVYSLSRLARSQRVIWTLLDDRGDYALPLTSATEVFETVTPMGRAMLGMLAVWAQLESDLVSERTTDAMAVLKARGVKLGRPAMEKEIESTVREIQELYATGRYTLESLAKDLNARGVPTSRGGKWWPRTVKVAVGVKLEGASSEETAVLE